VDAATAGIDAANAAQRAAFVDAASARALDTPDAPRTPEAVERAWAAAHREGRADPAGENGLTLWNFDVAAAGLKREHEQALGRFLAPDALGRGSALAPSYRITGGASTTGGEQFNTTISGRRADAVAAYLIGRSGVDRALVSTRAAGQQDSPSGPPGAEAGERYAWNRQVLLQRVPVPVPVPRDIRDEPTPIVPGTPAAPDSTLSPGVELATWNFLLA
jgi:outer membrane protein OmpA-like peptidoglycan-associated protein